MVRLLVAAFACVALPGCASGATPDRPSAVIETYAASGRFDGVVLVSAASGATELRAVGVAERAFDTPMKTNTRFRIASITKLFTATLILGLVEDGEIDLDAPFGRYLPSYPGEGSDRVSVRQLLSHASGLRQFDTVKSYEEAVAKGVPQYQRPATTDDLLSLCCSGALVAEPGKSFDYNNADYIVLGKIIESVAGKSFEAVLDERILRPLGLKDTVMAHWDAPVERLASSYFYRDDLGRLANDLPFYWENSYAAGAMISTADDVQTFADALFGGRIVGRRMLAELLRPGLDDYGLGLWSYDFKRKGKRWRVAKRPGAIMGAQAMLYRLLDTGDTIVILANTNRADLDVFAQEIANAIVDGN